MRCLSCYCLIQNSPTKKPLCEPGTIRNQCFDCIKTGPEGPVFVVDAASFGMDGHTRDAVPIAIAFASLQADGC